jgi:hyperosmotically inducible protein
VILHYADARVLGPRDRAVGLILTAGRLASNLLRPCSMEETMLNFKTLNLCSALLALIVAGISVGCSRTSVKSPDVSASIRASLDQAGFKDVSVSQDRDKGVVTLAGHVATDGDKSQAESVAMSIAGTQVVSNQIAVIPPGGESDAIKVNAALDSGIESNLEAALINEKLHGGIEYTVKNHVVTLTGAVDSQSKRARVEQVASAVPNVQQVVNELQVKEQKASSSN